ncbi:DUF1501 domain-containing protein [Luteimonas sp. MJ246]|uniref:DUF1501 domain-containing protein n=1 Tax=Luteimonas sp. MJ174 TaxID=3129237 RepID=UPI0031BAEE78
MSSIEFQRRDFLKGCCATAAIGAIGPGLLFSPAAHAAANGYDTIVHVFLRGGIDGLNLVVPVSGEDRVHYEQARPGLAIAASGAYGALPLTLGNGSGTGFGLHPSASGLHELWGDGRLAIVHGCGMQTAVTRSHFDAQLYLDLGTPGRQGGNTGWLARAWANHPGASESVPIPALAVNSRTPANLIGATQALTMGSPTDFRLDSGAWGWQTWREGMPAGTRGVNETLELLWNGPTSLELGGKRADASLRLVRQQDFQSTPPAGWPTSTFARQLWTVAQSIRFDLGLRYATVDLGGWDTHDGQGTAGSGYHYYQNKIAELSQALAAFYAEMHAGGEASRVTVVVQSEFGRRVRQNGSGGTDHGYGNPMLVLGGPVVGRRFYGSFAGLHPEILSPHFGDIPVTTDFRRVLWDILQRRMGHTSAQAVFPGYTGHVPLGIVQAAGATAIANLPRHPEPDYGASPYPRGPAADALGSPTAGPAAAKRPAVPRQRRRSQPLPMRIVRWHMELLRHLLSRAAP